MVNNAMRNPDLPNEDFGFLAGCIEKSPKAMPSDIDMVLERRGCFLFAEWKHDHEKVSEGQKIMLQALSRKPGVVVLIIRGDSKHGIVNSIYKVSPNEVKMVDSGVDGLKRLLNLFYNWADSKTETDVMDWIADYNGAENGR